MFFFLKIIEKVKKESLSGSYCICYWIILYWTWNCIEWAWAVLPTGGGWIWTGNVLAEDWILFLLVLQFLVRLLSSYCIIQGRRQTGGWKWGTYLLMLIIVGNFRKFSNHHIFKRKETYLKLIPVSSPTWKWTYFCIFHLWFKRSNEKDKHLS